MRRNRFLALVLVLSMAMLLYRSDAGDLNPPAGPVAGTMKTLSDVEPRIIINAANTPGDADSLFKIALPGSYYLTGDITGVSGKHGITISSPNVTLDLGGFTMRGEAGSLSAVYTSAFQENVVVRNGYVDGWDGSGIRALFDNGAVEDVRIIGCPGGGIDALSAYHTRIARCSIINCGDEASAPFGIRGSSAGLIEHCGVLLTSGTGVLTGFGSRVVACTSNYSTMNGFSLARGSAASGCTSSFNTQSGYALVNGCTVRDCTASENEGEGFHCSGLSVMVRSCAATENTYAGIRLDFGGTVADCTVESNGNNGIITGGGAHVESCSALLNTGDGISVQDGSTVVHCSAQQNSGTGIVGSGQSTVVSCTASLNSGNGIGTSGGTTVSNCTVANNVGDGIIVSSDCVIRNNTCTGNGAGAGSGAGIHITINDSDCRIEGNTCTDNDRGIDVDFAGNIIIRNTCSGNTTNWDVVAGNVILVINATTAGAVSGNSGGTAPGSTDPNANFTY